jgi:DNA-binding XRE family transcriptional regulator
MPKLTTRNLTPIDLGTETLGQRIARLRKERALTQKELGEKIGPTFVG